jgi:glycosyltransferase involved in cell wall biosynthesis
VLSVVVPTLGRSPGLPHVLRRLEGLEVLLVVDADGVVPGVPSHVRLLRAERPGASAARNAGIAAATQPAVLFLGDDIVPGRELLSRHHAFHTANRAHTAALLGHVFYRRPTGFMRWLERGIQTNYAGIRGDRAGWGHFYTTNVSVKRALLDQAGGFDEDLPFLYEDLDLGRRLADLGMDLRYDRRAAGEHRHRTTVEDWERRMELVGAAERAFTSKHPDVAPYFKERLQPSDARGRGARLAGLVNPTVPWLGPKVWASANAYYADRLHEPFMRGWDAAAPRSPAPGSPPRP